MSDETGWRDFDVSVRIRLVFTASDSFEDARDYVIHELVGLDSFTEIQHMLVKDGDNVYELGSDYFAELFK